MKLEARLLTSDILSDIDETLFEVSNLSAKIAFDNLLPTCEIGDEIAEYFIKTGHCFTGQFGLKHGVEERNRRWATIGMQRPSNNNICVDRTCECRELPEKLDVEGISQPFLLDDDEHWELRCEELELPRNDLDALEYCVSFFGREYAKFEIGYGGLKPLDIYELYEEIHEDEDFW